MALPKSNLTINFAQGLDTKTDPNQVPPGKFLALSNTVFQKGNLLQKRNGFAQQPALPVTDTNTLTTFGGSLVAAGSRLYNYAPENAKWYDKGPITPVQTDVTPLVRSSTGQTAQDVVVTDAGLSCSVWADSDGNTKYQVNDTNSAQIVVSATNLVNTATAARVFLLGKYFIITYLVTVISSTQLHYVAIPIATPTAPLSPQPLALQVNGLTAGYDGYVSNGTLYYSWYDAAPAVKTAYMNSALNVAASKSIAGAEASFLSVTANTMANIVWVTYYDPNAVNLRCAAYDSQLNLLLAPTALGGASTLCRIASAVDGDGVLTVFYELATTYSYSPSAPSHLVWALTATISMGNTFVGNITQGSPVIQIVSGASNTVLGATISGTGLTGNGYVIDRTASTVTLNENAQGTLSNVTFTVTSGLAHIVARSASLASKAAFLNDKVYAMLAYGGAYQPTYFLSDVTGSLIAKLAYSNGGGYPVNQVLPTMNVNDGLIKVGYLYKDLLTSVNKTQGVTNVAGIYSQTGINLVSWGVNAAPMPTAEIGGNLHLGGGFMWMYDGTAPVEHNFHVFPEDIATTTSTGVTPTATTVNGSAVITAISSMASVGVGCTITGTGIPANTTILSISGSTATLSAAATASASGVTMTIKGLQVAQQYYYQVVYEWTDAKGNIHRSAPSVPMGQVTTTATSTTTLNIPTLRLTAKTGVRIVIYRWSTAQQSYYQITSIANPLLNDTTTNSVSYVDSHSDAQILGNQLIYTTGGVVENIAFPPVAAMTLYKSRLVVIDAEDKNLLWYSKQVIESTPVEPSDLFTIYVAPTAGAQGSTGVNTALSAMDDKLITFKRNAIYYLTGTGPDNTGANNDFGDPNYITSTAGCTNEPSIVFMPQGLMFQSDKGIWLLGRDLSTTYVGAPVEKYNDAAVLSALNVPGTNQVRFTLDSGTTLMYDYFYGQWGTFEGIPGVSSTLYQNLHTYVNATGAVFQEKAGSYLDGSAPVLMSFTTGWLSLAGLQGFQRAYFFYLLGTYISPHKLSMDIAYDYNPSVSQRALATPSNYNPAYGLDAGPYGSGDPYGGQANVEQFRVFLDQQKCQSFQLTITESFDPSYGTSAGAGLTLSGINLVVGAKKSYSTIRAASSLS